MDKELVGKAAKLIEDTLIDGSFKDCAVKTISLIETTHVPLDKVVGEKRCPECKGSGKRTIEFNPNLNPAKFIGSAHGVLDCYKCIGTGSIPVTVAMAIEAVGE